MLQYTLWAYIKLFLQLIISTYIILSVLFYIFPDVALVIDEIFWTEVANQILNIAQNVVDTIKWFFSGIKTKINGGFDSLDAGKW